MRAGPVHRSFLVAATVAILAVTLVPIEGAETEPWLTCVVCSERGIADVLVNIILFLPLGAALRAAGVSLPRCVLGGALLSAGVELAQVYIPGRDPSLGDVVSNTLGSGLGAVLVATARYWLLPAGAQAARLCRAGALAAAALCGLTGWLLSPAPTQSRYFALWTPDLAPLEWYRGRVRDANVDDVRLAPGPIANSTALRQLLLSPKGFSLQVRAIAGARPRALGALLAVNDEQAREIVLLGPDRDDLVFRFRTRAFAWRLDQPDIRVSNALRTVAAGDPLDVTVHGRRGRYSMVVGSSNATGLGFTVGSGWAILMYPEGLPTWLKEVFSLAWVAALWAPAGFWTRSRRDAWAAGAALAAALFGVPAITPLRATPAFEWAAAGLGGLAGATVRRFLQGRPKT